MDETYLHRKVDSYSSLTEAVIDRKVYDHALKVWRHFECKTLGEYSDFEDRHNDNGGHSFEMFENLYEICI